MTIFGPTPKYSDGIFARRFRMLRAVFDRIYTAVCTRPEFERKTDALGKEGLHPVQRVLAALRMLAYGTAADSVDEYVRISESSALESLRRFCNAVCDTFGEEYGRQPTENDLRRILAINEMRGFPGCLGSIDCQHWKWERCPVAFAGQFSGKEKKPTVVLEAIADGELWLWHAYFGCPGSLNDLNVLNMSTTMASILEGKHPPRFTFVVDGNEYTTPYYLADGIYPSWAIFIKSLKNSTSPEVVRFSSAQEAMRKYVERAFRVLIARFHILKRPCLLRDRKTMATMMRACIIMRNMIVESRRDVYESGLYDEAASLAFGLSSDRTDFEWQDQASLGLSDDAVGATAIGAWSNSVGARLAEFTSRSGHFALTNSLVRHVWARHGAGVE
jgi:Plant transposon protein